MWTTPPFAPRVEGGWLYGRGARHEGGSPRASPVSNALARLAGALRDLTSSRGREECTGNAPSPVLERGYRAERAHPRTDVGTS